MMNTSYRMRHRGWLGALLLMVACGDREPTAGTPPERPAAEPAAAEETSALPADAAALLDKAIAAAGGLARLEGAASWTSRSRGKYMDTPFESRNAYRPGELRMEVTAGGEQPMTMVSGTANCWTASGPVVIPCAEEELALNAVNMMITEALRLAPLKQPTFAVAAGKGELDGKPCDTLELKHDASGASARLLIDPATGLVAEARYEAELFGRRGEFVIALTGYRERCGVQLPDRRVTTFEGRTFVEEETLELECAPPDPQLFTQPPQVADGAFHERQMPALPVACQLHRGPLDAIGGSMPKLLFFLDGNGLRATGPPLLALLAAPPAVTDPAAFATEICVPFEGQRPDEVDPGAGGAAVKLLPATTVLSVFGHGDALARAPELARLVAAEAAKRGLEPTGPPRMLSYTGAPDQPPELQVSELQLPVAGGTADAN